MDLNLDGRLESVICVVLKEDEKQPCRNNWFVVSTCISADKFRHDLRINNEIILVGDDLDHHPLILFLGFKMSWLQMIFRHPA